MILTVLIVLPLLGGLLAWLSGKKSEDAPGRIAVVISILCLGLTGYIWLARHELVSMLPGSSWILQYSVPWIPRFGINFHLAMDGLSLIMVTLTYVLGLLAILVSRGQVTQKTGFYHFNLLWILAGITGVFLALDLFLFYFFWEVMLIPMYLLIGIWGYENRIYAAYKFFIFTQASGLLMFLAILALYFIHGAQTGIYTFDSQVLMNTSLTQPIAILLMLGFMIGFAVKLPAFPFHNWLPDAHTEAPTAGSVILAGLLLKTGAYGMLRFVVPLFHGAVQAIAPGGMLLGVLGILYGAKLAFAQTDLKRLVAYTSVSHMGFVMIGVFAMNELAFQGVVMQMIAHGISTGALFVMVGILQHRTHTRDILAFSGLWQKAPNMGAAGLIIAMASLGLPGLGNFIAEFLILAGTFRENVLMTALAAIGLVAATIYALRIFQKVFQGPEKQPAALQDFNLRESLIIWFMVICLVWLGLFPNTVLQTSSEAVEKILPEDRVHDNVIQVDRHNPDTGPEEKSSTGHIDVISDNKFIQIKKLGH